MAWEYLGDDFWDFWGLLLNLLGDLEYALNLFSLLFWLIELTILLLDIPRQVRVQKIHFTRI
jgi:hypothetical protein